MTIGENRLIQPLWMPWPTAAKATQNARTTGQERNTKWRRPENMRVR
jgi:hypothetical protein